MRTITKTPLWLCVSVSSPQGRERGEGRVLVELNELDKKADIRRAKLGCKAAAWIPNPVDDQRRLRSPSKQHLPNAFSLPCSPPRSPVPLSADNRPPEPCIFGTARRQRRIHPQALGAHNETRRIRCLLPILASPYRSSKHASNSIIVCPGSGDSMILFDSCGACDCVDEWTQVSVSAFSFTTFAEASYYVVARSCTMVASKAPCVLPAGKELVSASPMPE